MQKANALGVLILGAVGVVLSNANAHESKRNTQGFILLPERPVILTKFLEPVSRTLSLSSDYARLSMTRPPVRKTWRNGDG
jgi:hypothetical protein